MLMTAANEGRRLFAAKDCSAAGRCRVTGFQRPFEQQKKPRRRFPVAREVQPSIFST